MEVRLSPPAWAAHLIADTTDWKRAPRPVGELAPIVLPDDAWFEYAWLDGDGEPQADPGGRPAGNPWWPYSCVMTGPEWRPHPDTPAAEARAEGRLQRHRLESRRLGMTRHLFTYVPEGPPGPRPLVVFQDGKGSWLYGRVGPLVDALTAAGELRPAAYAFLQPEDRAVEYAFHAPYRDHVLVEALPFLESVLPCDGERIAWGASLGGLVSAWIALEAPGTFRTVLSHSGAFLGAPWDEPHDAYAGGEWLLAQLRAGRGRDVRWSLECGTLEWLLGAHRRAAAALRAGGYEHRARERSVGHHWANWRTGLPDALRFALG